MLLRRPDRGNVAAIISICGAREFAVEAEVARRLDLQFDDVEVASLNDLESMLRVRARMKWAEQNGQSLKPPTVDDAQAIIEFARDARDIEGVVLCQCGAGMSRSPAAALTCLAAWTEKGQEPYCVAELFRVRPAAVPHAGLVAFADVLLNRNGALLAALRERDRHP